MYCNTCRQSYTNSSYLAGICQSCLNEFNDSTNMDIYEYTSSSDRNKAMVEHSLTVRSLKSFTAWLNAKRDRLFGIDSREFCNKSNVSSYDTQEFGKSKRLYESNISSKRIKTQNDYLKHDIRNFYKENISSYDTREFGKAKRLDGSNISSKRLKA